MDVGYIFECVSMDGHKKSVRVYECMGTRVHECMSACA
jgi:hypothetical protein